MHNIESERLIIRPLTIDDAPFILELLNDPDFIQNIADRGVRTIEDAVRYIENGPLTSYQKNGFGLSCVTLKESGTPIGMCGLIKRDVLDDVDIGYALLERYRGKGYAVEAAGAVLNHGLQTLGLPRVVAIIAPENDASARVLEKIGLRYEKTIHLPDHGGDSKFFVSS